MSDPISALPPEIRAQIYSLILLSPSPIAITSPRKGHPCSVIQRPAATFSSLSRVSQPIRAEISPIFWQGNTFLLSNGEFASPHFANIHALKAFVSKNRNRDALSMIRTVIFELRFGEALSCLESEISEMKAVARLLAKHFVGLESVRLEIKWEEWLHRSEYTTRDRVVDEEESKAELAKIVRLVLQHKGLKEVRWLERQRPVLGKLEALVEKVMKEKKVKEGDRVRVVAEEVKVRQDVKCDYWDQMRAQGLFAP